MRLFAHDSTCVAYFEGTVGYLNNIGELPSERKLEIGSLTAIDGDIITYNWKQRKYIFLQVHQRCTISFKNLQDSYIPGRKNFARISNMLLFLFSTLLNYVNPKFCNLKLPKPGSACLHNYSRLLCFHFE
jgi:hypothetical protein